MSDKNKRWKVTTHYRHDNGTKTRSVLIEELEEIQEEIEQGPHWDTIEKIVVVRSEESTLTVEQAEEM